MDACIVCRGTDTWKTGDLTISLLQLTHLNCGFVRNVNFPLLSFAASFCAGEAVQFLSSIVPSGPCSIAATTQACSLRKTLYKFSMANYPIKEWSRIA
ncbi:hypothetical protein KC19_3G059000 [Ceratodon purpureus]|uniref:Uncharacterized protein n=1 Tax=Ceratodon purpureus TaxID=3225 RepID=A0A8T0IHN5_CERPU|nr:hypothetical protein KC19_3G059000 [Ceratodon purpureus]